MSTSETFDSEIGACPCGKGQVIRSVTTQDNSWSGTDISYSIGCEACRSEWNIQHGSLVNSASEAPYKAAYTAQNARHQELEAMINPLVESYFENFAARTQKAEHAEMVRLGISNGGYRDYLKRRREGRAYYLCCFGFRNPTWLQSIADLAGVRSRLDACIQRFDEAKQASEVASRGIIRRRIHQ
jgi:hypothetical protein